MDADDVISTVETEAETGISPIRKKHLAIKDRNSFNISCLVVLCVHVVAVQLRHLVIFSFSNFAPYRHIIVCEGVGFTNDLQLNEDRCALYIGI